MPLRVIAEAMEIKTDYQNGVVQLNSAPLYVNGKALNSMTTHHYMTMGGWVYGYYGNANIARIYQTLQSFKLEEIPEPEHYGRHNSLDNPFFDLSIEFDFYNGQPPIFVENDKTEGIEGIDVYYGVNPGFSEEEAAAYQGFVMHDVKAGKWYRIDGGKFKAWWQEKIDRKGELLLNNVG